MIENRCHKCGSTKCEVFTETLRHKGLLDSQPTRYARFKSEKKLTAAQDACDARVQRIN